MPQVDGTDFYMFRSYEPGRSNYVTFIANYIPFESPYGGPNFFPLDTHAIYAINVSNDGGASADISFEFTFATMNKNFAVQAGNQSVAIPLINDGVVDASGKALNVQQSYRLTVYRNGNGWPATNMTTGGTTFYKPADNIGNKSIPDYMSYAGNFVYDVKIPGCSAPGRVFVGQRKDGPWSISKDIFDLREHQSGRSARRRAEYAHRLQRHFDSARSPDQLPHPWQRSGHRRLDHIEDASRAQGTHAVE